MLREILPIGLSFSETWSDFFGKRWKIEVQPRRGGPKIFLSKYGVGLVRLGLFPYQADELALKFGGAINVAKSNPRTANRGISLRRSKDIFPPM